jgi:hypothetical protein
LFDYALLTSTLALCSFSEGGFVNVGKLVKRSVYGLSLFMTHRISPKNSLVEV